MIRNYTWYNQSLDLNKPEAIHQVLAYGTIEEIQELFMVVGKDKVKQIFLNYPVKVYRPANLNFVKNYLLNIEGPIDEQKYSKNTLRHS